MLISTDTGKTEIPSSLASDAAWARMTKTATCGAVTAAADRWGLSSSANFSRAVREHFDVSPGTLVQLPDRELKYPGVTNRVVEFTRGTQPSPICARDAQPRVAPQQRATV